MAHPPYQSTACLRHVCAFTRCMPPAPPSLRIMSWRPSYCFLPFVSSFPPPFWNSSTARGWKDCLDASCNGTNGCRAEVPTWEAGSLQDWFNAAILFLSQQCSLIARVPSNRGPCFYCHSCGCRGSWINSTLMLLSAVDVYIVFHTQLHWLFYEDNKGMSFFFFLNSALK